MIRTAMSSLAGLVLVASGPLDSVQPTAPPSAAASNGDLSGDRSHANALFQLQRRARDVCWSVLEPRDAADIGRYEACVADVMTQDGGQDGLDGLDGAIGASRGE